MQTKNSQHVISATALDDVLKPVAEAKGLPNEAYTNRDLFEFERDNVLDKTWVRSVPTGGTLELEVKANWKLAVENYCEAYHLPCHLISIRQHIQFWRFT